MPIQHNSLLRPLRFSIKPGKKIILSVSSIRFSTRLEKSSLRAIESIICKDDRKSVPAPNQRFGEAFFICGAFLMCIPSCILDARSSDRTATSPFPRIIATHCTRRHPLLKRAIRVRVVKTHPSYVICVRERYRNSTLLEKTVRFPQ